MKRTAPNLPDGAHEPTTEATGTRTRRWGSWDFAFCGGLLALALLLRVVVVTRLGVEPTWDGEFYHQGAVSIARGYGYSEAGPGGTRVPSSHYPVGYSALLGAVYAIFGESVRVAHLTNAVVGALTAVLGYAFARLPLSRRRAELAGILIAVHPGLILNCALIMTEPLAGSLLLLSAYLALAWGHRGPGAAGAGFALALGVLVRPQSLLAAPLLPWLLPGPLRARARRTAIAAAVFISCIAPWSLRNCALLDSCTLVSTNGGWNLAIGALTKTGHYRRLTARDGCGAASGPVAIDRCWAKVGLQAITADPFAWLARAPLKLRQTYEHESFAIAYLAEAKPSVWPPGRAWRLMTLVTAYHHALLYLAALGVLGGLPAPAWKHPSVRVVTALAVVVLATCVTSFRLPAPYWIAVLLPLLGLARSCLASAPFGGRAWALLLALLALTTLTHAVFFGGDRYHLAVSPALCILAAGALRSPLPARRCLL